MMLLSFLSISKFEAAQNEAESEHDGELRRASRLNNAKRLIKANLFTSTNFGQLSLESGPFCRAEIGYFQPPREGPEDFTLGKLFNS
jgi:hypothetical protein